MVGLAFSAYGQVSCVEGLHLHRVSFDSFILPQFDVFVEIVNESLEEKSR